MGVPSTPVQVLGLVSRVGFHLPPCWDRLPLVFPDAVLVKCKLGGSSVFTSHLAVGAGIADIERISLCSPG